MLHGYLSAQREEAAMNERRRHVRQRTLKAGKIEFNRRLNSVDCVIRNFSEAGACLEVEGTSWLPAKFDLRIPIDGVTLHCRSIWRSEKRIGVTFEDETRHGRAA